jgi:hypothetical protein
MNLKVMKYPITILCIAVLMQVSACTDITNVTPDQLEEYTVRLDGPGSKKVKKDLNILLVVNHQVVSDSLINRIRLQYVDSISVSRDIASITRYDSGNFDRLVEVFGDEKILTDLKPDTSKSSLDN